ncbi:hypothetical protein F4778DRAFT_735654 [Xylariomycetidae sp. FL2044]|nr:hypothetical protein F4778DRAFT_735654 [Xylariomycetidae sp. FL2044]
MYQFSIREEVEPSDIDFVCEAWNSRVSLPPELLTRHPYLSYEASAIGLPTAIASAMEGCWHGDPGVHIFIAEFKWVFVNDPFVDDPFVDNPFVNGTHTGGGGGTAKPRYRTDRNGNTKLLVGAAVVQESFPGRLSAVRTVPRSLVPGVEMAALVGARERDDWLFLSLFITHSLAGRLSEGAGAALMDAVRGYARNRGKTIIYVDCWTGCRIEEAGHTEEVAE